MKTWKLLLIPLAVLVLLSPGCGKKTEDASPGEGVSDSGNGIQWYDYETGMAKASQDGKYVIIDFWTTWCHWCKALDEKTYSQQIVQQRLADSFIAIKVNAESGEPQGRGDGAATGLELARRYGVNSYPTVMFVDPSGQTISPLRGFMEAPKFARVLDFVSSGAYKTQKFQDYMASGDEG